jgi:RNA ligase (TIGR02306 family)
MSERKLVTVRTIAEIKPIEGADRICAYRVDGWWVIDAVGKYQVDDIVLYAEPDSWIPTELAAFLSRGKEPREFNGVKGEKLKTIKMKGQLSQGLLFAITPELLAEAKERVGLDIPEIIDDEDFTEFLGVQKWEAPVNAQLAGKQRGNFPYFIRKTDEERVQNMRKFIAEAYRRQIVFEVSLKLDGSSTTVYHNFGEMGVCSRNIDLQLDQEGNAFVDIAHKTGLLNILPNIGRNLAIQGELMGEGIQGNREKLTDRQLFIYKIFDIENQVYLTPKDRYDVLDELYANGYSGKHVPVLAHEYVLPTDNIDELLAIKWGTSLTHPVPEGVVLKSHCGQYSFKIINNEFLLLKENQ